MNQEHALAVLYDLTLAVGSEIRLELLLKKVLQRFLFHTSFPVGTPTVAPPSAHAASIWRSSAINARRVGAPKGSQPTPAA